jgi:hypothetical protein
MYRREPSVSCPQLLVVIVLVVIDGAKEIEHFLLFATLYEVLEREVDGFSLQTGDVLGEDKKAIVD